ncbi:MAG TPA: D-aminoacyl-tRNA deacylase [Bryobacteraceae bacterium]|nr:D-aminoacyl-tRNA deacylase [Bryobacteraceae bacterium]
MRVVIQRVTEARVQVDDALTGAIGPGLLLLLAISKTDTEKQADYLVQKILGLRVFPDDAGKMNRSVCDVGGSLLIVSQFTLYGDCRKGRRPSFDLSASPSQAERLYQYFVDTARRTGISVETGVFQAHMRVTLVNDGPVTLICDA